MRLQRVVLKRPPPAESVVTSGRMPRQDVDSRILIQDENTKIVRRDRSCSQVQGGRLGSWSRSSRRGLGFQAEARELLLTREIFILINLLRQTKDEVLDSLLFLRESPPAIGVASQRSGKISNEDDQMISGATGGRSGLLRAVGREVLPLRSE
jgi:hypothetical protein